MRQMNITRRALYTAVTQHQLHASQVYPGLNHVRRVRMAQCVWRYRFVNTGFSYRFSQCLVERHTSDMLTTAITRK